ncbi:PGPGW domain-containing protein [Nocardioides alcanivorans]|uniref:PGPGW domain-containing protein n=1 Tax=Nocardioides alcanivorans TaxID=2897352 RepID=UPI001F1DE5B2|nr:PGPGW domain-containing protein [Nocardioides alcanivorans]
MSETATLPRSQVVLARLDGWAAETRLRRVMIKSFVAVTAPLVIVAGVAMLVLPGPGLVTIAAGFSLLAVGFPWARHVVGRAGRAFTTVRQLVLPKDCSPGRRLLGTAMVFGFFATTTVATTAITAWLGAQALV